MYVGELTVFSSRMWVGERNYGVCLFVFLFCVYEHVYICITYVLCMFVVVVRLGLTNSNSHTQILHKLQMAGNSKALKFLTIDRFQNIYI